MATATDVVNIGLRRIGSTRISNLLNDNSNEARIARDIYDEARRDLLSQHTWNFAIKRDQLTVSATTPEFGWDYAYPLPDDFLRVISVTQTDTDEAIVPYKLEFQSGDDRVILTNSNQLYLRYVFDCDDVSIYTAPFRDALSWRLARDFAAALSKSSASAELAEKMFIRTLNKAKALDGVEDWPEKMSEGDWVAARFGYDPTAGQF